MTNENKIVLTMTEVKKPNYQISDRPDGFGYYYGTLSTESGELRLDIMPPRHLWQGDIMSENLEISETEWILRIDNEEYARVSSEAEIGDSLGKLLTSKLK